MPSAWESVEITKEEFNTYKWCTKEEINEYITNLSIKLGWKPSIRGYKQTRLKVDNGKCYAEWLHEFSVY